MAVRKAAARPSRQPKPLSGWHAEDVKAAVRKKGETLSALSRKYRFSDSYLRGALSRPRPHAETIIAEFLGVPAWEIWPDRYRPDGTHKNQRLHRKWTWR